MEQIELRGGSIARVRGSNRTADWTDGRSVLIDK